MKKWIAPSVEELEFKDTALPLPWDETSGEEEGPLHDHHHHVKPNPAPVVPGPVPPVKHPGGPADLVSPDHLIGGR